MALFVFSVTECRSETDVCSERTIQPDKGSYISSHIIQIFRSTDFYNAGVLSHKALTTRYWDGILAMGPTVPHNQMIGQ